MDAVLKTEYEMLGLAIMHVYYSDCWNVKAAFIVDRWNVV
jgi:hypothetical protein